MNEQIIQAYLEGSIIEFRWNNSYHWAKVCAYEEPADIARLFANDAEYRIKPKKTVRTFHVKPSEASTLFLLDRGSIDKPNLELTFDHNNTLVTAKVL